MLWGKKKVETDAQSARRALSSRMMVYFNYINKERLKKLADIERLSSVWISWTSKNKPKLNC